MYSGAHIPGPGMPWLLNFVCLRPIFVGPLYWSCFASPFWRPEFCGGFQIFGKLAIICLVSFVISFFPSFLRYVFCVSQRPNLFEEMIKLFYHVVIYVVPFCTYSPNCYATSRNYYLVGSYLA